MPLSQPVARSRISDFGRKALEIISGKRSRRRRHQLAALQEQLDALQHQLVVLNQKLFTPHMFGLSAFRANTGMRSIAPNATSTVPLDIVVPLAKKDAEILPYVIQGIRRNIKHPIGTIYVIAPPSDDLRDLARRFNCMFVDENTLLSLRPQDIKYEVNGVDRSAWLFQQILKLASDTIVSTPCYLIVDADTVFVRPQVFELDGRPLLLHSDEHHAPYFRACEQILGWPPVGDLSCIGHTMLYDSNRLAALKNHMQDRFGRPWYEVILQHFDRSSPSGFAEQELYGQWCLKRYPLDTIREYWFGANLPRVELRPIEELERVHGPTQRLVAFHHYLV